MTATMVDLCERNEQKSTILLIVTGGTLTMVNDPTSQTLKTESIAEGFRSLPEFQDSSLPNFDVLEWNQLVDSSDVAFDEWIMICEQIKQHYGSYDGFVVIHGTDTMAFTSSALSFMLEQLGKPVVLTGSMLPIRHICTDGKRNLAVAMMVAAYSQLTEVCVLFGSKLLRGNRARKLDCSQMEAFDSPNFPALGRVGVDITVQESLLLAPSKRGFRIFTHLCQNLVIVKLTPMISAAILDSIFASDIRPFGVIIELYGCGTAPKHGCADFEDAIKRGIASGVEIAGLTQCVKGSCNFTVYENGSHLYNLGVIECKDMTPEAVYAKMSYLMGKGYNGNELRVLMQTDIRGEICTSPTTVVPELQSRPLFTCRSRVFSGHQLQQREGSTMLNRVNTLIDKKLSRGGAEDDVQLNDGGLSGGQLDLKFCGQPPKPRNQPNGHAQSKNDSNYSSLSTVGSMMGLGSCESVS